MSENEQVLEAVNKLVARIDALEQKLGGNSPMVVDGNQAALQRIAAKADVIERAVDALAVFEQRLPVLVDAAATVAGQTFEAAAAEGIDPIDLGLQGLALLPKVAHPDNLALAEQALRPEARALAGKLLSDDAVAVGNQALSPEAMAFAKKALTAENIELLDTLLGQKDLLLLALKVGQQVQDELEVAGVDLDVTATKSAKVAARLAGVLNTPEFDRLLDSGALDKDVVGVVGDASTALVETKASGIESVGPFGALFKLMDGDVSRAVGFTLGIAKRFGAALGR